MNYKLLALDLDDTLLCSDKKISQANINAVEQAQRAGVQVLIVTGRTYGSSKRIMDELGLSGTVINYGGAQLTEHPGGKVISLKGIPGDLARQVIRYMSDMGLYIHAYKDEKYYYGQKGIWSRLYGEHSGAEGCYLEDFSERDWNGTPKLLVIVEPEHVEGVFRSLREKFNGSLGITTSISGFVELNHPDANKGRALKEYCESRGIRPEQVIAVGDNTIDLSMIDYAGLGVCVANGVDELKEIADVIAPSNNEDAVKWVVDHYILGGEENEPEN